jgi:Flp pilus assembly protein protease CpaA
MYEIIFLIVLAGIWIAFASIHDLKKRIVPNWVSFSLIIFALGFRFFYSLFELNNFMFFYQGLIGLGIFFVLGNALYYGRMFAGGDAKLMMAIGTILPFTESIRTNLEIFTLFLIIFLFTGAIYGIAWSIYLSLKHFKELSKEFNKQFNKYKRVIILFSVLSIALMIYGFIVEQLFLYLGILTFIFPYLYIYAKSIDNSCLVNNVSTKNLEEGDWLYKDLKVGKNTIKSSWHGLTKNQIKTIQKKFNKIQVRQGIPFIPVFFFSFLILVYIYFQNFELINLFGNLFKV